MQCHVFIEDETMVHPNLSDKSTTAKPLKLLDQVRDKVRIKYYSIRTEQTGLIRPGNLGGSGLTRVSCSRIN